jgi:hypothetical protein
MRLDVEVVKGQLGDLAKAGSQLDAAGVASFVADVHAQLGRVEAVLKVVGSPPEAMADTFLELLPQGSPSDFQRMADLKVGAGGGSQLVGQCRGHDPGAWPTARWPRLRRVHTLPRNLRTGPPPPPAPTHPTHRC